MSVIIIATEFKGITDISRFDSGVDLACLVCKANSLGEGGL